MVSTASTIWIIAGEESGDVYGARLAQALAAARPGVTLRGMGGRQMAAAGVDLLVDSTELAIVGLVEVIRHLPTIRQAFSVLLRSAAEARPDAVVLIDYPGFNIRLASRLHAMGIPVVYYVSPQVWAWKKGRRHRIAATVDKLLCIFPFEPDVYSDTPLDVEFIGHPLLEILAEKRDERLVREPDTVLLLPGSRRSELERLLEPFIATARELARQRPSLRFVLTQPREALAQFARERISSLDSEEDLDIRVEVGRTHEWMQRASAGLAASGTVTVEAAILGLPLVVAYRLHWLTYLLARMIVKLPYFTMVNLVAGREVFAEFSQGSVNAGTLSAALGAILPGGSRREQVLAGLTETVALLGGGGQVSALAAARVLAVADGG
jgi:lipid-A-disaccharide synthase